MIRRTFDRWSPCREATKRRLPSGPRTSSWRRSGPAPSWPSVSRQWQAAEFNQPIRPFGYLVQDFEPGFYPWSAQWALARRTYAGDVPTIAVINTSLLRDHLAGEGIRFADEFTFEPRLATALRPFLDEPPRERTRRIVVYGRPETPRNAFPLVVDGLREWARTDPKARGWKVESAGRKHPSIEIAPGLRLRSLGKLELATTARSCASRPSGCR